jgi:hypothetical protein
MSKITLIIIITLLLGWLLYVSNNKVEKMEDIDKKINIDMKINDKIPDKIIIMPPKKCIVKQKSNFIPKPQIVDGHNEECPKDAITIKQFNKDFFNFRDKTTNNSSLIYDPVDKINDMFIDGTIWTPKVGEDVKPIADIFDDLTKNVNINSDCTRIPTFESVMYDGYEPEQLTGLYSSGNEWIYKNESDMNGGQLDTKLYPHDNDFSGTYPLSAFPPMKPTDWTGAS